MRLTVEELDKIRAKAIDESNRTRRLSPSKVTPPKLLERALRALDSGDTQEARENLEALRERLRALGL